MAIDISNLRMVKADQPPRILAYGPPGIGKTSLASEFPDPVFLQVEEGTPGGVELASFGLLQSYADVMDAITALYQNDVSFKTVVLDSITAMQRLIYAETCARGDDKGNKKANIEDFGYGKGYVYAGKIAGELMDGLNALRRDKGMTIILIAHSKVERFDDPETVSYDRYEIDLHDKLRGGIERDMDCIFLMKSPVSVQKEEQGFNRERSIAAGGAQRWIHTMARPAFTAKNRYKIPDKILYTEGNGYAELSKYLPTQAVAPAAKKESRKSEAA